MCGAKTPARITAKKVKHALTVPVCNYFFLRGLQQQVAALHVLMRYVHCSPYEGAHVRLLMVGTLGGCLFPRAQESSIQFVKVCVQCWGRLADWLVGKM